MRRFEPKPPWLKVRAPGGDTYHGLKRTLRSLDLYTVCSGVDPYATIPVILDAGAYDWSGGANPGWAVTADFKDAAPTPIVTLTADQTALAYNTGTTLRWISSGATSCSANGDWAGPKALTGAESTGALTADRNYALRCQNGTGAETVASVSVAVAAPGEPPPAPADPPADTGDNNDPASAPGVTETGASSSGSALGIFGLLLCLPALVARRRRQEID